MSTFELNHVEIHKLLQFSKTHDASCSVNREVNRISISVSPTGIADKIVVKCKKCSEEEDISDYDSW